MAGNLAGPRVTEWVRSGLPVLAPPAVAMEAVEAAAAIGQAWAAPSAEPVAGPRRGSAQPASGRVLDEAAGKDLLRRAGVPVPAGRLCNSADGAAATAGQLPGPFVVKGQGVAHKTEQHAVRLGLSDPVQVRSAAAGLLARYPAVLVERMVGGGLAELLVGVEVDPVFGPVLSLGAGGVLTELLADVAHLVLPADPAEIRAALLNLRCARLLTGYRGAAPADLDGLVDLVLRVAGLALRCSDLLSLEINPLIVTAGAAVACDALVVVSTRGVDERRPHPAAGRRARGHPGPSAGQRDRPGHLAGDGPYLRRVPGRPAAAGRRAAHRGRAVLQRRLGPQGGRGGRCRRRRLRESAASAASSSCRG